MTDDIKSFDGRLRETEAQTREQGVRIDALAETVRSNTEATTAYVQIVGKMVDESRRREEMFWRAIYILIGTVVALAVGPKMADKLVTTFAGAPVASFDIIAWHEGEAV